MNPALISLIAASVAFVGTHFAFSHPLRAPLVRWLGEMGFRGLYSLVAIATFIWMVLAFRAVGTVGVPLWNGIGDALWAIASVLMLLASVLLVGSFIRNPALPHPGASAIGAQETHGVFHATRHPMMWAFALWAASHILVSPTPRSLVLAGAIGFLALVGAHMQDCKKALLMGAAWTGWAARTSYWPRLGGFARAGAIPWLGGISLWLLASWAHIPANGMAAGVWRWIG